MSLPDWAEDLLRGGLPQVLDLPTQQAAAYPTAYPERTVPVDSTTRDVVAESTGPDRSTWVIVGLLGLLGVDGLVLALKD